MLRIALPNKGRLTDDARDLFERAGLEFEFRGERSLLASLGGEFLALFVRAQDIPEFVADGAADVGITGRDLVTEAGRDVDVLLDLGFGRCRLVVAGRDDAAATRLQDLPSGTRVATAFPRTAARFFQEAGLQVDIVPVTGAAEIAPHLGVADVIVDLVATGSTLKVNGLREIATILESTAVLVSRPGLAQDPEYGQQVRELVAALESVIRATDKRYLMANVPRAALAEIKRVLPGISGPTIVDVMDSGEFVAAHAVVDRRDVYRTIAELKELGAEGILVTRIERLMP
ncbi:MAG TPA: ATP phosphoribosyltransferase [Longimicrobiales bacterium]|nr:ATP phosphoribosyltransferase [Longimicrobiales bacterium]